MLGPRTKNQEDGFTLIETLIAISILVLAVTGAFAAAQNGLSSAQFSKDQIIAFYLAQEGVEEIRNRRDANGLAGTHWLSGISEDGNDPCYFGSVCKVDAVTNVLERCGAEPGSCEALRVDPEFGFFGYDSSWDTSAFTREIELEQINSNEAAITVTVTWSKGLISRIFRARENILNWQ